MPRKACGSFKMGLEIALRFGVGGLHSLRVYSAGRLKQDQGRFTQGHHSAPKRWRKGVCITAGYT